MSDYGWHFLRLNADGVPVLRDGRTPAPELGEWLEHDGTIEICARGLHGSWRALDALQYVEWDGAVACLVEVEGVEDERDIGQQGAKFVCRRRRIVAIADADDVLRTFAREQALLVAHLWDMPPIVREFLETGDESKRAAAWDAARAAAWDAARAAARAAAWDAARAAAWDAARAAAADLLESMFLSEAEFAEGFEP